MTSCKIVEFATILAALIIGVAVYFALSMIFAGHFSLLSIVFVFISFVVLLLRGVIGSRSILASFIFFLLVGFVVSLVASSITYEVLSLIKINYLRCMDGVNSGAQVLRVWMVRHGLNIYPALGPKEYLLSIYPPGYFALAAVLDLFLSDPYRSAMAVSGLGLLLICGVIYLWTREKQSSFLVAILVVLAYLSHPSMAFCLRLIKTDLLGWAIALWGAYIFFSERYFKYRIVIAGLLLSLSVFIKQQAAVSLIGCVSFFVVRPGYFKKCTFLAIVSGIVGLCLFFFLQVYSGGNYLDHTFFYPMAMSANPAISNFGNAIPRYKELLFQTSGWFVLLVLAWIYDVRKRCIDPLGWLSLVSLTFVAMFLKHWGAAENYYWGFLAFACMSAGGVIARVEALGRSWRLVVVALLVGLYVAAPTPAMVKTRWQQAADFNPALDGLDRLIEGRGFSSILMNSEASASALGRSWFNTVTFYDALDLYFHERAGLFKTADSQLALDLSNKKYDAVVCGGPYSSPILGWRLANSYLFVGSAGVSALYVKRLGRIVLYASPDETIAHGDGVSLKNVGHNGLYSSFSFGLSSYTLKDNVDHGDVIFELSSDVEMHSVQAFFVLKVAHFNPQSRLEVEMSGDGVNFDRVDAYFGTKSDMDKDFQDSRHEVDIPVSGRKVWIRFVLYGSSQLWFGKNFPLSFNVS